MLLSEEQERAEAWFSRIVTSGRWFHSRLYPDSRQTFPCDYFRVTVIRALCLRLRWPAHGSKGTHCRSAIFQSSQQALSSQPLLPPSHVADALSVAILDPVLTV